MKLIVLLITLSLSSFVNAGFSDLLQKGIDGLEDFKHKIKPESDSDSETSTVSASTPSDFSNSKPQGSEPSGFSIAGFTVGQPLPKGASVIEYEDLQNYKGKLHLASTRVELLKPSGFLCTQKLRAMDEYKQLMKEHGGLMQYELGAVRSKKHPIQVHSVRYLPIEGASMEIGLDIDNIVVSIWFSKRYPDAKRESLTGSVKEILGEPLHEQTKNVRSPNMPAYTKSDILNYHSDQSESYEYEVLYHRADTSSEKRVARYTVTISDGLITYSVIDINNIVSLVEKDAEYCVADTMSLLRDVAEKSNADKGKKIEL